MLVLGTSPGMFMLCVCLSKLVRTLPHLHYMLGGGGCVCTGWPKLHLVTEWVLGHGSFSGLNLTSWGGGFCTYLYLFVQAHLVCVHSILPEPTVCPIFSIRIVFNYFSNPCQSLHKLNSCSPYRTFLYLAMSES